MVLPADTQEFAQVFRAVYRNGLTITPSKAGPVKILSRFDKKTGKQIILLNEIELAFPNLNHVRKGDTVISILVDDDSFEMLKPHRIAAYPDFVLDVVLEGTENESAIVSPKSIDPVEPLSNKLKDSHIEKPFLPLLQPIPSQPSQASQPLQPLQPLRPLQPSQPSKPLQAPQFSHPPGPSQPLQPLNPTPPKLPTDNKGGSSQVAPNQASNSGTQANGQKRIDLIDKELELAKRGDVVAQLRIAELYFEGIGFMKDYSQAVNWYMKAANQGNAEGEYNVGYMYQHGYGVKQDYSKAMEWYLKAADKDYTRAQTNIGYMYQLGLGVQADSVRAAEWCIKAAVLGNTNAMNNVGCLYLRGTGVKQDYVKAIEWFQQAAKQGNEAAQENLDYLYQVAYGGKRQGQAPQTIRDITST
ncbi:hypothetical protein BGZ49_007798 [Haplosporangium sp. Z 27]|nr:hypothetical protein BGZ49_007798 [Haplosporangium sp. Z 27]